VVGCAQLTLIPGLTRGGALRLMVEGVHVANHLQGRGLGSALFAWIDDMGRSSGARFAQLTSDKKRPEAHRFYGRLGWVASHEGFKKPL
jgi:GNAT superfamily N-acetyltransferase